MAWLPRSRLALLPSESRMVPLLSVSASAAMLIQSVSTSEYCNV